MTTWFTRDDCRLEDFRALVEQKTDPNDYPSASRIEKNVPIYESLPDRAELIRALLDGPGIVVFAGAFETAMVDRATGVFAELIAEQKAAGVAGGDHFAKPGANDRVWGAL